MQKGPRLCSVFLLHTVSMAYSTNVKFCSLNKLWFPSETCAPQASQQGRKLYYSVRLIQQAIVIHLLPSTAFHFEFFSNAGPTLCTKWGGCSLGLRVPACTPRLYEQGETDTLGTPSLMRDAFTQPLVAFNFYISYASRSILLPSP